MNHSERKLAVLTTAWLIAIAAGFAPLLNYAARPGVRALAPTQRPQAWSSARPTLVMVLHPRCACSRASLRELERLLAHLGDRVDARALITGPDSESGPIVTLAASIAGLKIERDPAGDRARLLGAQTSGETYVYGKDGALLFHGGLTLARGHEGASPAQDEIMAALTQGAAQPAGGVVFGCRLGGAR